ncbi:MAG: hypothetical protein EHM61_25940 [Acidobacteria bacterium]|nr:MAG: hypothetical protein EHM61_25940 [Acidobacteriota bacterium]
MKAGQAIGGRLLGAGVVIYIFCFLIYQSPKIFDYYRVSDDTRQQIYPLYLASDGQLFHNDLLTRYFRSHTPPFYYYAHYPLAWAIDAVVLSKVLQFGLLAVVLVFLYRIGVFLHGGFLGWTLVFLTVHSPTLAGLTDGGLPRGWAVPGLIVFVWAVLGERQRVALAATLVSGLFYPPIFLVLGPSYAVWTVLRRAWSKWDLIALGVLALGFWPMVFRDPEIGRIVTLEQAQRMPEWQIGSRFPFLPMPSLISLFSRNFVVGHLPPGLFGPWAWLLVAVGLSAFFMAKERLRFAAAVGLPLGFSLVMFEVSRLVAFRLHIPDRNLKYTIPFLGLILITVAGFGLISWLLTKARVPGSAGWTALLVIVSSIAVGGSGFAGNLNLWADQRFAWKLYEFVERLPKDALLAGPPGEMDNIPLFSRRKVYVSDEANQPLYDRYYQEIRNRLTQVFKAYYATDLPVVADFRKETGVDYVLVRKEDFTHRFRRTRCYYEPYNDYILSLKGDRPAGDFFFANPPGKAVVYDDGYFQVVDLAKLTTP